VDTGDNCIAPETLEARMQQRHIRFQRKTSAEFGPYLQFRQGGNDFSIAYPLRGSCIEEFQLEQITKNRPSE
jgi:hypothetical protein